MSHERAIAIESIRDERERQERLMTNDDGTPCDESDKGNTANDWAAIVLSYVGRAAKTWRNAREGEPFRANMVKAAATCLAAIEAFDKGYVTE